MNLSRPAEPALRPYVRSLYGFEEITGTVTRRREGPGASVVVVVSFEHEWRLGDARDPARPFSTFGSFVAGLHDGSVLTEHDGRAAGMQINLTPPAAYMLLGRPMHELARTTVALDDVLGPDATRLVERLRAARTWDGRFELLAAALQARLADAPPPSPGVVWAWRRLAATHGAVRIATLCEELGWSRKRLAASFHEQVGLPPKAVARMLRLERAMELAEARDGSWAEIALAAGYYDQSHLVNEFREITGTTPTAFAAEQLAAAPA